MNSLLVRAFALLLLLLLALPVRGQQRQDNIGSFAEAEKLFAAANDAFEAGNFAEALAGYERLAAAGYSNAQVFGNAGTAAARLGDAGRAVLNYRRALRVDPGNERALSSLRVVSPATNDRAASFLSGVIEAVFRGTPPMLWAALAQLALVIASVFLWLGLRSSGGGHRYTIAAYGFVFTLLFGFVAGANWKWRTGGEEAVILNDRTIARSEPSETSQELVALPAGTVVTLTELPLRGFVRVRLADGTAGFVATNALERI